MCWTLGNYRHDYRDQYGVSDLTGLGSVTVSEQQSALGFTRYFWNGGCINQTSITFE